MRLVALALALALVVGAATHILVVLNVPEARTDTVLGVAPPVGEGFGAPEGAVFAASDPALVHAACAYDLVEGAVRVVAAIPSGYWGVSVHDDRGLVRTQLNDRAAQGGRLDILFTSGRQARALDRGAFPDATRVRLPAGRGLIVLRALVDRPSQRAAITAAVARATCEVVPIELPPVQPQVLDDLLASAD